MAHQIHRLRPRHQRYFHHLNSHSKSPCAVAVAAAVAVPVVVAADDGVAGRHVAAVVDDGDAAAVGVVAVAVGA